MIHETDVAVVGAGSAGLAAWRAAKKEGRRALLIEGGPYGTTCARVGCMPSKLLIAAAERYRSIQSAEPFGVLADNLRVDGRVVMDRVRRERDRFVGFVVDSTEAIPAEERLRGWARFRAPGELVMDNGDLVRARSVVLATGSHPAVPPTLRGAEDRLIVNDDVFDWQDLPESVAVFGAGVIGLELGQALAGLGVDMHLFSVGGGIGPLQDPALIETAREVFSAKFWLDADARVDSVERVTEGVRIRYRDRTTGESREKVFDYVLSATGRLPNVRGLALENAGLTLDARGMPNVDPETLQAGDQPVFLPGDVNGVRPLLHEASDEGRIAGYNAARFPVIEAGTRRTPMAVVFSHPQIGQVGLNRRDLDRQYGDRLVIGRVSFANQGRARVMGENEGAWHLYVDPASGVLLGAEGLSPGAEHMAHLLAWSIARKETVADLLALPFYHPVLEEGLRTALRDAEGQLGGVRSEQAAA